MAVLHQQKEKALKIIGQYGKLREPKRVEEIYDDAIDYFERVPRVEPEAAFTILESMGNKGISLETFADNSIVDRLVREGFIEQLYKKRWLP